jgi:hypothetical protein
MPGTDPIKLIQRLFHFTDTRNLPLIRRCGGLLSLAALRKKNIDVPAPGGNEWSHDADHLVGLDKYVHLCFRKQHPMEYRAKQDGRIVDPIFLEIAPDVLAIPSVLFTPDVSNKSGVKQYTVEQALKMIDFEVLYKQTDWRDPAIRTRLNNAEKCEVLVPDLVPLALIRNLPNG